MDLGGRANMDLTEAARLMKQSTTSSTVTNPAQMQPPPLMMMQQAVAMQQFQYQQALLMQQVMATQQAAARAATVKSAAEMAAARAAEISKQLKGSDAEEEDKKPAAASPSRSKSRSPSRSRSASRSKSRSPIRYRRDRSQSRSRSPIRYRRDRPYSPSRSRDYYSYRSRSRRGYYRGRGDYPWNPFRREWDRDRDRDYYPRSRRSRSRSKLRRRSRSRSRSPRFRRGRTPSPRFRREERRPVRGSRRSRSRDTKRTPSLSSRSPSASPVRIESRSPGRKLLESDNGVVIRELSVSPVPIVAKKGEKESSQSPAREDSIRSPDVKEDEILQREERVEQERYKETELSKRQTSISPPRSLSVSLNHSLRKDLESEDDVDISSHGKKAMAGLSKVEDSGEGEVDPTRINPGTKIILKGTVSSSDVSSDEANGDAKLKGHSLVKPIGQIKRGERNPKDLDTPTGYESEDDKELDDWRDDVKFSAKGKSGRKDGSRDSERRVEEKKSSKSETPSFQDRSKANHWQMKFDSSKGSKRHATDESRLDTPQPEYSRSQERTPRADGGRKELRRQESFRYRGRSPVKERNLRNDARGSAKSSRFSRDVDSQGEDTPADRYKVNDQQYEEDMFEAPTLPIEEDEIRESTVRPVLVEDYKDVEIEDDKVVGVNLRAKNESDLEDEEEARVPRGRSGNDEDATLSRKWKDKARPKDRRYDDDEEERDRRKERHKRHRKKHRKDKEDEKDADEDEKDDGEGRKDRKRHKRKHRKEEDDERREKRRRKHKSRGKSVSDSGDSPRADVDAGRDDDGSPVRKKRSSRHKKRRREPSKSADSASSSD